MDNNRFEFLESFDFRHEDAPIPFPLEEYRERLLKIRKKMEAQKVDLLYVTTPENLYYVSGVNQAWLRITSPPAWDDGKATGIAIHVDHEDFLLFDISDEEWIVENRTCCKDPRIKAEASDEPMMYGKQYDGPKPGEDLLDVIVRDLKNEGWLKGNVALEMGSARPNRRVSERLQAKFEAEGCRVVDGTEIIPEIRGTKSPLELEYVRKAADIADIGHRAVRDNLREGITELALAGKYISAMYEAGGENMAIVDMCRFGFDKFWSYHAPASRRRLRLNEPVVVDLAGVYNRYHANQNRAYFFGEPTKEIIEIGENAEKVMRKMESIIKPYMLVNDFYAEMKQFFEDEGIWGDQYWLGGYELGISFPPDWVGTFVHEPLADAGDKRFMPGMVTNFESGFGVIDTLVFTEEKAEILGTTPWGIQVVTP